MYLGPKYLPQSGTNQFDLVMRRTRVPPFTAALTMPAGSVTKPISNNLAEQRTQGLARALFPLPMRG
jgi:hypothetical protein